MGSISVFLKLSLPDLFSFSMCGCLCGPLHCLLLGTPGGGFGVSSFWVAHTGGAAAEGMGLHMVVTSVPRFQSGWWGSMPGMQLSSRDLLSPLFQRVPFPPPRQCDLPRHKLTLISTHNLLYVIKKGLWILNVQL